MNTVRTFDYPRALSALALATLLAANVAARANDKPSRTEVSQARQVCLAQQHRMMRLDEKLRDCPETPKLRQLREAAEQSCYRAETLMEQAGLEPPAAKPQPPPPTPSLTIRQPVKLAEAQTPQPEQSASFASLSAENCEHAE